MLQLFFYSLFVSLVFSTIRDTLYAMEREELNVTQLCDKAQRQLADNSISRADLEQLQEVLIQAFEQETEAAQTSKSTGKDWSTHDSNIQQIKKLLQHCENKATALETAPLHSKEKKSTRPIERELSDDSVPSSSFPFYQQHGDQKSLNRPTFNIKRFATICLTTGILVAIIANLSTRNKPQQEPAA